MAITVSLAMKEIDQRGSYTPVNTIFGDKSCKIPLGFSNIHVSDMFNNNLDSAANILSVLATVVPSEA
jgi:hypothetical protein